MLKRWFGLRSIRVPRFLMNGDESATCARAASEVAASFEPASQGRPKKAAWDRIAQALFKLRAEHPRMRKKELAFEARKLAAQEFDEAELPSAATIQRKISEMLLPRPH